MSPITGIPEIEIYWRRVSAEKTSGTGSGGGGAGEGREETGEKKSAGEGEGGGAAIAAVKIASDKSVDLLCSLGRRETPAVKWIK